MSPTSAPSESPIQPPPSESTPSAQPAETPGADGWIGPQLISNRPYGDLSLVIDESGTAHAAAVLNDSIFYLTNEAGSWTRERLTRPAGHDWDPSIALDGDGSLHVAFTRWPPEDPGYCPPDTADCFGPGPDGVHYVTNRGGGWSEPARLGRAGGNSPSLAVRDGYVHLAYLGRWVIGELSGPGPVRYRTDASGSWTDERVGLSYGSPQLVLGSDGRARLAFWDIDDDDSAELYEARLWYAIADAPAGPFMVEQLPVVADAGWVGEMWLDLDGIDDAHVIAEVWGEGSESNHYWSRQGGAWGSPLAVFHGDGGRSMAVGMDATVHVLAAEVDAEEGESWRLQYLTLRSGVTDGRDLSARGGGGDIALDKLGRPHVLFVVRDDEGRSGELWYAIGPAQ